MSDTPLAPSRPGASLCTVQDVTIQHIDGGDLRVLILSQPMESPEPVGGALVEVIPLGEDSNTLHSFHATDTPRSPAGPPLCIVFDQALPAELRHEAANAATATSHADWEGTWRRFYADEAARIVDALSGAIPGGLMCALLADLARRQAGIFAVAVPDHWRAPACVEEIDAITKVLDDAEVDPAPPLRDRVRLLAEVVTSLAAKVADLGRDNAKLREALSPRDDRPPMPSAQCTLCGQDVPPADRVVGQASGPRGVILQDDEIAHRACLEAAMAGGGAS